jgi:hypothetical protein
MGQIKRNIDRTADEMHSQWISLDGKKDKPPKSPLLSHLLGLCIPLRELEADLCVEIVVSLDAARIISTAIVEEYNLQLEGFNERVHLVTKFLTFPIRLANIFPRRSIFVYANKELKSILDVDTLKTIDLLSFIHCPPHLKQ